MNIKTDVINEIIELEGGYVFDHNDSGGETNFGITLAVAIANGYKGKMRDMPREFAFSVYARRYWDSVCGDEISLLSESIVREVVDTAVNMGPARAGKFLQTALNALNKRGSLYSDLVIDGDIGPATVKALRLYLRYRNEEAMLKALNCLQGAFYIELTQRREKDEAFLYGWLLNRVEV